jgi:hypothetical protein
MALKLLLVFVFLVADMAIGVRIYHYATRQVAHKQLTEKALARDYLCGPSMRQQKADSASFADPRLGEVYSENLQKNEQLNCPSSTLPPDRASPKSVRP